MKKNLFTPSLLSFALAATFSVGVHAADIKLGVAEALSGGAAQYGISIRNGFQLAADEINASGGVNGDKLQLVVEDEQGKKEEAINVFKKLIFQDKVLMVFGPTLSNSAQAADPIAQAAKVVELRYFAGMTIEETAEALNLSKDAVCGRWDHARTWLRREMALFLEEFVEVLGYRGLRPARLLGHFGD